MTDDPIDGQVLHGSGVSVWMSRATALSFPATRWWRLRHLPFSAGTELHGPGAVVVANKVFQIGLPCIPARVARPNRDEQYHGFSGVVGAFMGRAA